MALTTYLDLVLRGTQTNPLDLVTGSTSFTINKGDSLTDGTGAVDTADLLWTDTRTLPTTSENIDLAGVLSSVYGATITAARVKAILIHNKSTTVGQTLTIGGAGSNPFLLFADSSDKYVIGPNGIFFIWEPSAAAKAVTASTGDILKIESSASITYDIAIVAASA
jgi:hypothetical protein